MLKAGFLEKLNKNKLIGIPPEISEANFFENDFGFEKCCSKKKCFEKISSEKMGDQNLIYR